MLSYWKESYDEVAEWVFINFADDGTLLASTRSGTETAVCAYQQVGKNFDLTVSIPYTKHMITSRSVEEDDWETISLEGGVLKHWITDSSKSRMDLDIDRRIAQTLKAFSASMKFFY